jgi:hypothetical protein
MARPMSSAFLDGEDVLDPRPHASSGGIAARDMGLISGLIVQQRVQGLKHQNLEHQHTVVGRPTALRPIRPRQRRFQINPEHFEIDDAQQPFQRIACGRQCLRPLIPIEKSRLPHDG